MNKTHKQKHIHTTHVEMNIGTQHQQTQYVETGCSNTGNQFMVVQAQAHKHAYVHKYFEDRKQYIQNLNLPMERLQPLLNQLDILITQETQTYLQQTNMHFNINQTNQN